LKVDLVLTGGDRLPELERFFRSVAAQTWTGSIRVIFVDQAGSGIPGAIAFPGNVRVERIEGGRLPLSVARNLALGRVDADLVAFPDDDCWYPPALLEQVWKRFQERPAMDGLCLRVFDPILGLPYGKRPAGLECVIDYRNLFRLPISVGFFVRRRALEGAGARFDENLGAGTPMGSGEETELLGRLLEAGAALRYDGGLDVYHPYTAFTPDDAEKYHRYGRGFGYVNGRLIQRGRWAVLPFALEAIARSAGGWVFHAGNPVKRRVYGARLRGIVSGLAEGYRESR
jgi:glycosyltransferase involved in cell wall biosynthesis